MMMLSSDSHPFEVALLTEGVDRNENNYRHLILAAQVALLTEGVDRNKLQN